MCSTGARSLLCVFSSQGRLPVHHACIVRAIAHVSHIRHISHIIHHSSNGFVVCCTVHPACAFSISRFTRRAHRGHSLAAVWHCRWYTAAHSLHARTFSSNGKMIDLSAHSSQMNPLPAHVSQSRLMCCMNVHRMARISASSRPSFNSTKSAKLYTSPPSTKC